MSRTISILRLAPLALALACEAAGGADTSDQPVDENDDGEPASSSEPTGGDPTGPAADFGPGPVFECDPWLQDCPEGQKCNLYSTAGDQTLDGARCVPLDDSPAQIAELCIAEGGYGTGLDDCAAGLLCWNVIPSEQGVCVELCDGAAVTPQCPEGQVCAKSFGDYHYMCLATCDPLAQDCIEGELCALTEKGFACAAKFAAVGACAAPPP
ncbi:hypothetical protein [Nannocystis bainbridge]|uniref:Uncharacterized protein n=1 Tax=Nannocystis bainbridge TaxID=2995303 RepID=A0ABT5EBB2_9BACT|nr:hypothetical protein [Nannocystis bainbridge]MDC0723157.1 hypothetical protein [Nannocystis bainbridge]